MASTAQPTATPVRTRRGRYAKTAETREKILSAAWEVAEERGFHKVSLSEVASRAEVAVGNVSYHFGSREALVRALMRSVAEQVTEHVVHTAATGRDYFERADAGLRGYLDFVRRHPAYVRLGDELRHHRPEIWGRYVAAWLELHRTALRRGIEEGALRPMSDAEIGAAAHFIVGVSNSIAQMLEHIDREEYPGDDVVVGLFMTMLRGGLAGSHA